VGGGNSPHWIYDGRRIWVVNMRQERAIDTEE